MPIHTLLVEKRSPGGIFSVPKLGRIIKLKEGGTQVRGI